MVSWRAQTYGPTNRRVSAKLLYNISTPSCTTPEGLLTLVDNSHSAVRLGKAMFPLFALALHLDEDFFEDKVAVVVGLGTYADMVQTVHSAALMKVLHYPPQTGPVDGRVLGIGAHTE